MKKILAVILFTICFQAVCFANQSYVYTIGRGDKLEISVWGYPELTRTLVVRPDGNISFPLVDNEIKAEGMTPQELDEELTREISKEVKEPKVAIIVTEFGSKKIIVLGEVMRPGIYNFTGMLSTLEAVTQAGGYRDSACLDSVLVIRERDSLYPQTFRVNLTKVIKKTDKSHDVKLQPDDVVYVPRSFIGKLDKFVDFFKNKVNYGIYYDLNE